MPRRKTPKGYISFTQAKEYSDCPRRYQAKYIEHLVPERNHYMAMGSVMHSSLKILNDQAKAGEELSAIEDVDRAFELALRTETKPGEIPPGEVQTMLDSLRTSAFAITRTVDTMIDAECEFSIPYTDSVKVLVIIDRLDTWGDSGIEITDYKFSNKVLNKKDLAEDLQLLIYAWAVVQNDPTIQRVKLTQYMLRHNFANSVEMEADQVQGVKKYLDYILEGIESKQFEPKLNLYCNNCPVRAKCDAYRKRYIVNREDIKGMEEAHREYLDLNSAKSTLDARKEIVKAYIGNVVEESGPQVVSSGLVRWEFHPQDRQEAQVKKLAGLFKEFGLDITPLLGITSDNLDKAENQLFSTLPRKKVEEFLKRKERCFKRRVVTALRPGKVKD